MITGVVLTHNEARNIVRCIRHLRPHVSEIILIDTCSTDDTVNLAKPLVDVVLTHPHVTNFDSVRNIAIPVATHDWLWFVDADEFVPKQTGDLVREWILDHGDEFDAITIPFKTFFCGKWMEHGGWWPGYTCPRVLRRGLFQFSRQLHGGVELRGREILVPADGHLAIEHQSFRDLSHWLEKSNRYTTIEAMQLAGELGLYDWREAVRAMTKELWKFYEQKQGVLDGEHGWVLALCSAFYRWFTFAKLIDLGRTPGQQGKEPSNPHDIEQFIDVMTRAIAECRIAQPQTPLGLTLRIETTVPVNRLIDCIQTLLADGRAVILDGSVDLLSPRNQHEAFLLSALANGRRAKTDACVTLASIDSVPPAGSDHYFNIVYLRNCANLSAASCEQIAALTRYDEIWLDDTSQSSALIERGLDSERIVSEARNQFVKLPSLLNEIDSAVSPAPVEQSSGLPLVLQGEFFLGHSFSNLNERMALGFRSAGQSPRVSGQRRR